MNQDYRDWAMIEGVLFRAMDDEGLTYGETVAIICLIEGARPFNNNPGIFAGMEPVK